MCVLNASAIAAVSTSLLTTCQGVAIAALKILAGHPLPHTDAQYLAPLPPCIVVTSQQGHIQRNRPHRMSAIHQQQRPMLQAHAILYC